MKELIDAILPVVELGAGISIFLSVSSMLIGWLAAAFTGRNDRGRFF